MKIEISKKALERFKKYASRKYPNETFAILLGRKLADDIYSIREIHVPKIKESTYQYVIPDYDDVNRIIKEHELDYFGEIHSHPQFGAIVSREDYKYWDKSLTPIIGILSIRKRQSYKTTELFFWQKNSACPIQYKYIEE